MVHMAGSEISTILLISDQSFRTPSAVENVEILRYFHEPVDVSIILPMIVSLDVL